MLPYWRRICTFRLHVVENYLINYLALYVRLTRSRTRVELASPAYLGLRIILIIILTRLRVVRNYLNNYFAMYTRLTHSRIRVELAFPSYLWLRIT